MLQAGILKSFSPKIILVFYFSSECRDNQCLENVPVWAIILS
jgi:hypothetical protein